MFLIWGFSSGTKQFDFTQTMICKACGQFGKLNLFMTYRVFTLFFIPIIKFGKQYYIQMRCCSTIYAIDKQTAQAVLHGEQTEFTDSDLRQIVQQGHPPVKYCKFCGVKINADDNFCPKCGNKQE